MRFPLVTTPATPTEGDQDGGARALFRRQLVEAAADVLDPSLYGFVLRYSLREQVYLVVVTLLSFPFLYYLLELPKVIINEAIGGKHFPREFLGRVLVMDHGRLVTDGDYATLTRPDGPLAPLMAAE